MIIALLLAAVQLPDPAKDYAAYERFTHGEFRCDDRPRSCRSEADPGPMCDTAFSRHILRDKPNHRPRRGDPWVRRYRLEGESRHNARVHRADDVVNGCDG